MARTKNKAKKIGLLTSLLALAVVAAGGTIAFLADSTQEIVNVFTPTSVPIEVVEDFDGETKENVQIKNNGNIPAYIRATYVVNWANGEGNILGTPPVENTDYTISLNDDEWIKVDHTNGSYYYYQYPVEAGNITNDFVITCAVSKEAPVDGYYLQVEILAQSVQSVPLDAIEDLWNVKVTADANGVLTFVE